MKHNTGRDRDRDRDRDKKERWLATVALVTVEGLAAGKDGPTVMPNRSGVPAT